MKKIFALTATAIMSLSAKAVSIMAIFATGAGDFPGGEWNPEEPAMFDFAVVDNDTFQYTLEITNLTRFKLSFGMGDWATFDERALGCRDYGDEPGVTVDLERGLNTDIVVPWKGDYTLIVTMSNDLSCKLTLLTTTPRPTDGPDLYVRGSMNAWGADENWVMTKVNENTYRFEFAAGQMISTADQFKIADADWGAYNIGGTWDEPVSLGLNYEVFNGGNPDNMTVIEDCSGVMWLGLNLADGSLDNVNYLWLSNDKTAAPEWAKTAGMETVTPDEDAPTRYFNLQGIEVAAPESGLYIVSRGNTTTKEYILK